MRKVYVAYGSNLNLEQMAYRCPDARPCGVANWTNRKLVFRGHRGNGVLTVEHADGYKTPILLWDISEEDEASLDIYEGYPHLYRKEYRKMTLNGEEVNAMIYVMNEGRPITEPSPAYYAAVRKGYKDCKFDLEILDKAVEESQIVE